MPLLAIDPDGAGAAAALERLWLRGGGGALFWLNEERLSSDDSSKRLLMLRLDASALPLRPPTLLESAPDGSTTRDGSLDAALSAASSRR
jgi:hypothetical protein